MENLKKDIISKDCPSPEKLNDYLTDQASVEQKKAIEKHIANCDNCLATIAEISQILKNYKSNPLKEFLMKTKQNINIWFIFAVIFFILSFIYPKYFVQLLTATIILALKWIMDNKNTKLLIMIHEAWKKDNPSKNSNRLIR